MKANSLGAEAVFRRMQVTTEAGTSFPYHFRHMSGITEAFAIFTFLSEQHPDIGQFLEAIPDRALFMNINKRCAFVISTKKEVAGEIANYIRNRARCERKDPLGAAGGAASRTGRLGRPT
ncbi:terpenoid synthase [Apiospora saccharicola]|uniref:Terpenoid synthase n=1 Tax=Apiospora saccharicola TaxID=335842 RepID=A0ABR1U620_9PEZI